MLRLATLKNGVKAVAFAAAAFVGLNAVSTAEAHPGHGPNDRRCVAAAITAVGSRVRNTRSEAVRPNKRRACRRAIRRCERRLHDVRRGPGFNYPLARCRVISQGWGRGHAHHNHSKRFRCVAEAERRNGRDINHTRSVETRKTKRRACAAAVNECEVRLDRQRRRLGRPMRRARCTIRNASRVRY